MATQRITIPIRGMTCAACVARVEQALRQQPGVIWASVNFAAEEVMVFYDPSVSGPVRLAYAVRTLGFGVSPQSGEMADAPPGGSELQRRVAAGLWLVGAGLAGVATLVVVYLGLMALIPARSYIAGLLPVPWLPETVSFVTYHPISSATMWLVADLAGVVLTVHCIDHLRVAIKGQVR